MQFLSFDNLKKYPVIYFLFLTITAIMTLFFVRESDIRRERKEVIQEKIELKQKNERLEKKVSDLSEALMDCTTKNQIRSILDSLNKK